MICNAGNSTTETPIAGKLANIHGVNEVVGADNYIWTFPTGGVNIQAKTADDQPDLSVPPGSWMIFTPDAEPTRCMDCR